MFFRIASDIPGRLRLDCGRGVFDGDEARGVACALMELDGVTCAEVHPANGSVIATFSPSSRDDVLAAVRGMDVTRLPRKGEDDLSVPHRLQVAMEDNRFVLEAANLLTWRLARWAFLPAPLATAWTLWRAAGFVGMGLRELSRRRLSVEVLDATAIAAPVARGAIGDAANVMTLIRLTDVMERHVQNRVSLALGEGLVTRAETVWAVVDGRDVRVAMEEVREGQVLHLGAGSVLPVDGTVVEGAGDVDESSMTGESRLVRKEAGATVYAGTALEDGDLKVSVIAPPGKARIDGIVDMVRESTEFKSQAQSRAERLADSLVPYSFLAFGGIYAVTRNVTKAMAVLMVDYSCAIRLSTPICVMAAMSEGGRNGIVVKGGKYLEALAAADTIVFDKTGTLTHARPAVGRILTFGDAGETEVLRYAACIEEHFPHSVARAIVDEANRRGLGHESELHARVDYVVAHGISTTVGDRSVLIGSHHFLFDDEGIEKPAGLDELVGREAGASSVVYMAEAGRLTAAICIDDPIRPEARDTLRTLRALGVEHVVMLTGDSANVAASVAAELGVDEWHAQVLPEDKSDHIERLRAEGRSVIMVGDGINDSPALAAADVSVAMADASDIARAVADVSVLDSTLESLVTMRRLAMAAMGRVRNDYRLIVGLNSALIALGVAGVITTNVAATMHNGLTLAIAAANNRTYLRDRADGRPALPVA